MSDKEDLLYRLDALYVEQGELEEDIRLIQYDIEELEKVLEEMED